MAELKTRKTLVVAANESSYGTDASPTGAEAILVSDVSLTPMSADTAERNNYKPYLGARPVVHTGIHVQLEFYVELAGSGDPVTPPGWGQLLRACGCAETIDSTSGSENVSYAPVSADEESATLYTFIDGQKHAMLGARGTWSLEMNSNSFPRIRFQFWGIYVDPASVAAPSPDFSVFRDPVVVDNTNTPTFTVHGYQGTLYKFSLEQGNSVTARNIPGDESAIITDRQSTGSIEIGAPAIAAQDFFTKARNNDTGAVNIVHGTAAGNIVELSLPAVQITEPNYGDQDGTRTLSLNLRALPASGDDEWTITTK
ncbi:phage tail tube protein [Arhodomonas sp. AD133]|uniref:phage tail tube protein n=1 Tax=Arhodomonas sp. AD133 TaxID=3415009 RepID=UPI003EBE2515